MKLLTSTWLDVFFSKFTVSIIIYNFFSAGNSPDAAFNAFIFGLLYFCNFTLLYFYIFGLLLFPPSSRIQLFPRHEINSVATASAGQFVIVLIAEPDEECPKSSKVCLSLF